MASPPMYHMSVIVATTEATALIHDGWCKTRPRAETALAFRPARLYGAR